MLVLGIDDSGRGPMIGPMILAGCLLDENLEKQFKKLGVKDSKQVTPKKREVLAREIKNKAITFEITITHPDEITARNKVKVNLNDIEAIKAAEIINKISKFIINKINFDDYQKSGKISEVNKGIGKVKVILDCPSPNIKAWQAYLEEYIDNRENLDIICEHKADVNHISVSAASILAKSTREFEIGKIKNKIGKDFGSGYSSDPVTCEFLEKNFEQHKNDGIFRETWSTWKNLCNRKTQKKLGEF